MASNSTKAGKQGGATKLTPKQQRFVEEYMISLNATQAAIKAGYSAKTASQLGLQLLRNLHVAEAIAKAKAKHAEKAEITLDRIVAELANIAFANADDYFDWGPNGIVVRSKSELTRAQRGAVSEVAQTVSKDGGSIRVKLHDKLGAVDRLTKLLGLGAKDAGADAANPIHVLIQAMQGSSLPVKP